MKPCMSEQEWPGARILLVCAVATLVFGPVYIADLHYPRYAVPEGVWMMEVPPGVPSIGWYGRLLWACVLSTAAGVVTALVWRLSGGLRRFSASPAGIVALTLVILVAFFGCAGWFVVHEWQRWM